MLVYFYSLKEFEQKPTRHRVTRSSSVKCLELKQTDCHTTLPLTCVFAIWWRSNLNIIMRMPQKPYRFFEQFEIRISFFALTIPFLQFLFLRHSATINRLYNLLIIKTKYIIKN